MNGIYLGNGEREQTLDLRYANRHGLIAGATGTGKTITLQSLAEQFSLNGVPVLLADVKGDLSGIALPGEAKPRIMERLALLKRPEPAWAGSPSVFWDVFGKQGHPMRTTISEMGPLLLSRLLELSDAQSGVLTLAFELADRQGLLLLDIKDLQAILGYIDEHASDLPPDLGHVSTASTGTIQRKLLAFTQGDAEAFFGEPAFDVNHLLATTPDGMGYVHILAADALYQQPTLHAATMLWLLSELYETLPEAGDLDKPKLVIFFDEAHLLFDGATPALVQKVEQVVRLIRSKGVGLYFVTQNPQDIPESVLGQLGNRVQHALRAFTPKDQKAVKVAAETFRPNPKFATEDAITQLAVGEALVSLLEAGGAPSVVDRVMICPPHSRIGPVTETERTAIIARSPYAGKYERAVDRESAYEKLTTRTAEQASNPEQADSPWGNRTVVAQGGAWGGAVSEPRRESPREAPAPRASNRQGYGEALAKSVIRAAGSRLGRELVRGVLGSLMRR